MVSTASRCAISVGCVAVVDGLSSGVAPIAVDEQGENAIIIVSGANSHLREDDVLAASRLVQSAAVVVCQLEVPPQTSLAALKLAHESGGEHNLYIAFS